MASLALCALGSSSAFGALGAPGVPGPGVTPASTGQEEPALPVASRWLEELDRALAAEDLTGEARLDVLLERVEILRCAHVPSARVAVGELASEAARQGRDDYVALAVAVEAAIAIGVDGGEVALELMDEARALLPADASTELRGRFASVESELFYGLDLVGQAAVRLRDALELADASASRDLEAECLLHLLDLFELSGLGFEPEADLVHAEEILREAGDEQGLLHTQLHWAEVWLAQGHEERALEALEELVEESQAAGDLLTANAARIGLYDAALRRDDFDAAIEFAGRQVENARLLEDLEELAWCLDQEAWVLLLAGRPADAEAPLAEASELAERIGTPALLFAVADSARFLALSRRDGDALLEHSTDMESLQFDGVAGSQPEERALADKVLRELRADRRVHYAERAESELAAEAAAVADEQRVTTFRWSVAVAALVFTCAVALVFYRGKRRVERMHARLRAEAERAQEHEDARRHLERHLSQVERLDSLGLLAAGIAHDFNNILCSIIGNAELMRDDARGAERERAESILQGARRAGDLCKRMLDYSMPSPDDPERIDLREVAANAKALLDVNSVGRATVEVAVGDEPVFADVERTSIEQVLVNLVTNAQAPSVEAKRVVVSAELVDALPDMAAGPGHWFGKPEPADGYAVLRVDDDGAGMSELRVRRAFDPFFTTKFEGHGLGLSAAYGIVAGHGGAFHVVSDPGAGSSFRAYLPVFSTPVHRPPTPEPALPVAEVPSDPEGSLLVVDDEPAILAFVSTVLRSQGREALTASSGTEALEVLEREGDDVRAVLLDVTMPDMDGIELLERIRQRAPALPAAIMSGHGAAFVRDLIGEHAVQHVLAKPFRMGELEACLAAIGFARQGEPQASA